MHTHLDVTTQGESHRRGAIESIAHSLKTEPSRDERPMGREGSASPCKVIRTCRRQVTLPYPWL